MEDDRPRLRLVLGRTEEIGGIISAALVVEKWHYHPRLDEPCETGSFIHFGKIRTSLPRRRLHAV